MIKFKDLNKNNKYLYRRICWNLNFTYISVVYFSKDNEPLYGMMSKINYKINSIYKLSPNNQRANDWVESTYLNPNYVNTKINIC